MSKEEVLIAFYNSLIDTEIVLTGESVIQALAKYMTKQELEDFLIFLRKENKV